MHCRFATRLSAYCEPVKVALISMALVGNAGKRSSHSAGERDRGSQQKHHIAHTRGSGAGQIEASQPYKGVQPAESDIRSAQPARWKQRQRSECLVGSQIELGTRQQVARRLPQRITSAQLHSAPLSVLRGPRVKRSAVRPVSIPVKLVLLGSLSWL